MTNFSIRDSLTQEKYEFFVGMARKLSSGFLITARELEAIDEIVSLVGISIESDSTRLGYLVPLDRLSVWFNDQNLADQRGLDDSEFATIADSDRLSFARELLGNLGDHLDADIHPSLLSVALLDQMAKIVVGYSISGYSFSGIETKILACGVDEADLTQKLRKQYLLIDDRFFLEATVEAAISEITDDLILGAWERG
jgi:hypothetical protein